MSAKTPSLAETIAADAATPLRPAATGGEPQASDGDTRLLQQRLALFGLVGTLLSSTGLALIVLSDVATHWHRPTESYVVHVLAIGGAVAGWLVGRGRPRSKRVLEWLDVIITISVLLCFAFQSGQAARYTRPDLVLALITFIITTCRAVILPSSPRRTFAIAVAAWLPAFVLTYALFRDPMDAPDGAGTHSFLLQALLECLTWAVLGVVLVTIASRVIFGLRREVRQAQKLGQYTLLEKLGEGGMGQVFRAQHAMLRRPTAVKLLHPDRVGGAEDLARFEREVQLTAQLSHPNVVTVFDYGRTPDGVFYYAMELLQGHDLEDIVASTGPMTPARVVHILAQVTSALAEAHAVGLIHRDIKPANIILCTRGSAHDVAKVVDFGLVKQLGAAALEMEMNASVARETGPHALLHVSRPGTILGTPMYLAPEAMRDPDSVDGRTDLYALGAVAYFLLTGTTVFGGTSVVDACRHHLLTVPEAPSSRLRAIRPDGEIPQDVEAIVLQCLAKAPGDRFASAKELLGALASCSTFGEWSDADGRRAWAKRAATHVNMKTETSWTAKTIAIDVGQRQPPEPPP